MNATADTTTVRDPIAAVTDAQRELEVLEVERERTLEARRAALLLAYQDGHAARELARLIGISEPRMHKILKG